MSISLNELRRAALSAHQDDLRRREEEQAQRHLANCATLQSLLEERYHVAGLTVQAYPFELLPGMRFTLEEVDGAAGPYQKLAHTRPCPVCDEPIVTDAPRDLAALGALLERPPTEPCASCRRKIMHGFVRPDVVLYGEASGEAWRPPGIAEELL